MRVTGDCMTRAPVIKTGSVAEALELGNGCRITLKPSGRRRSQLRHGKLLKIDPIIVVGSYVYPVLYTVQVTVWG